MPISSDRGLNSSYYHHHPHPVSHPPPPSLPSHPQAPMMHPAAEDYDCRLSSGNNNNNNNNSQDYWMYSSNDLQEFPFGSGNLRPPPAPEPAVQASDSGPYSSPSTYSAFWPTDPASYYCSGVGGGDDATDGLIPPVQHQEQNPPAPTPSSQESETTAATPTQNHAFDFMVDFSNPCDIFQFEKNFMDDHGAMRAPIGGSTPTPHSTTEYSAAAAAAAVAVFGSPSGNHQLSQQLTPPTSEWNPGASSEEGDRILSYGGEQHRQLQQQQQQQEQHLSQIQYHHHHHHHREIVQTQPQRSMF